MEDHNQLDPFLILGVTCYVCLSVSLYRIGLITFFYWKITCEGGLKYSSIPKGLKFVADPLKILHESQFKITA